MAIKRLSFYVTDADVTIRSDDLPLKKFLNKQTMNSKVNNWAVELEQFRLHLHWIPGSKNLLADSLSHLIDVVPDAQQSDKPKNHEFGSYSFKELEPVKVLEVAATDIIEPQAKVSENVDYSQKLWKSSKTYSGNGMIENIKEVMKIHPRDSEFSKQSQNSQVLDEVETFELKYEENY